DTKNASSIKPAGPPVSPKPKSKPKKGSDTVKPLESKQKTADDQKQESQIYEVEAATENEEGNALPRISEPLIDSENKANNQGREALEESQQNVKIETKPNFANGRESVDQNITTERSTDAETTQKKLNNLDLSETNEERQIKDTASLESPHTNASMQTSQPQRDSDNSFAHTERDLPHCGEAVTDPNSNTLQDIPSVRKSSLDSVRHELSMGFLYRRGKGRPTPDLARNQFLTLEDIQKWYAQRDLEESQLRNRGKVRTLDELRGPKATGMRQLSEEGRDSVFSMEDESVDPLIKHKSINTRISRVPQRWELDDFDEIIVYEAEEEMAKTTEIIEEKIEEVSEEIKREPSISQMHYHCYGLLREIGVNTVNPCEPIHDDTPINHIKPYKIDMNHINELFARTQAVYGTYEVETGSRSYYEGCKNHFLGRNHWSRLFRDGFQGTYLAGLPMHWIYTVLCVVLYILFACLFSMAWIDHVTEVITENRPVAKMVQPYLSLATTLWRRLTFDERNDTEVNDMYTRTLEFFQRFGDSGENERFDPCTADQKFGYLSSAPCVFLKINRQIGFKTVPYTHFNQVDRENNKRPHDIILKSLLRKTTTQKACGNRIWFTCTTKPKNKLKIEFYPEAAVRTEYTDIEEKFVKNSFDREDLNRIVALKLRNLKANERVDINCKIWAQNIHHNSKDFCQVSFFVIMGHEQNRQR
ncbi:blast:Sodium/potassium-transporting ATPase subunit beta-1, partial [Drosophila guanche]